MKIKRMILRSSLILSFVMTAIVLQAQVPSQIPAALRAGDAKALSAFFNETIELVIVDQESVCSGAQGEMILRDFFSKNKPLDFQMTHQGGSDSAYGIGKMKCSSGNYRIYFMLKKNQTRTVIVQLRIEKD